MARDSFDESKNTKKKVTKKKTEEKKPQSSSVTKPKTTTTKADKVASKSTFLGGGASVQKVEQAASKPTTVKKPANTKKQTVTKQDQINQKMYGTTKPNVTTKTQRTKRDTKPVTSSQRKANAEANMNLKQRNIRDTAPVQSRRTATTTAAQRQKMGMPTQQDLQDARASRRELANSVRSSVREASSEENKGFMQRQKSGTLTASDKQRIEQTNQRRAEVARNTGAVAKKAIQDTGSGYAQSIYDLTELTAGNKNGTQAKAMKMGLDPVRDRRRIAELEREQKYTAAESKRRRDELFQKQEQRQAEWDERTKNAKGLEKAWYGAVESGTGMVADTLVGAATGTGQFGALASMGLRTYGPSAMQARKEGATDKEARLYGLAQSAKEVGTELMFQGAGLAKAAYGKTGLSLADKSANILTKGLTGLKADAVGAGVRALGGTAEENIEEIAGWMADPLIKELTYGKAVRNRMKENLRANIPQIGSDADAAHVASYFSTPKFTDDLTNEYVKSGMSRDKASALAAEMRDYYVAYYSGDKGRLDALEEDLAAKLSGQDKLSFRSWSMDELKDTLTSTTLLTLATGLPGAVTTSAKGNRIFDSDEVKAAFGNDAARKVADAVKNTSNKEMSLKAETMEDRLKSGKDLTGTQKFDLWQGYIEKVNETAKKARASNGVVENARQEQDLVPTMGVDRAGNTVYAKETQREYDEKYAETAVTAESLRRFMESDNSISDDEIRRTDAAIKAVSDLHVGGLTIGDAHEFAYGNNLARETLKIEEGIDLDKYIVRKADGTVDLAATNEATENALFRINADNAIKAAQAETEVFIDDTRGNIDKDLLTRFGNNGQAVWKEVNKDLDPRNLQEYLTNANAASYFYSAGRNTDMGVDSAINRFADTFKTVDKSLMKRAFAAGARDRIIANTPGYGQTVESGSNIQLKKTEPVITGQLIMDDDVVLADSDQSAYLALAMSTNTNIHIVSNLNAMGKDGKPIINQATGLPVQLNGMSHGNDIYLNMNEASEKNLGYVFMHEMTHQIKQYAPNEYLALENLVRDKWFNKDATGMQAAIKQRMDLYSVKGGQQLTEEEAVEEIIADAMAEAMDDPNFAAEVCEQDINLGQQILDSIRAALRSIRNMFASTEFKNDKFHNSLLSYLGILDEAEKMWLNALATAKQNKADGLIADWQDRANKQNAPRLSVTEVSDEELERIKAKKRTNKRDREILRDAGEKLKENDFYNLYTAHIINLGGKGKNADQMVESIKENGFKGSGGFGVNLVDSSINNIRRQTEEEIRADYAQYGIPEDRIEEKINQLKETTSGPNRWIDGAYYEGINVTVDRYGGRKGQTVMFVPEHHTTDDRSLVETGFKPFDYEVVKVERDFQPYYELYSKAYDDAHEGRYSITPQQDADYMKAVESNDMDTAQRMVDEAARNAGYTVEAFHGTKANFNKFRKNSHFGSTVYQALDRLGFYNDILDEYEDDPEVEELLRRARDEENAKVMRLHIKAENPIRLRDLGSWDSEELREGLNEVGIDLPTDYKGADIVNALKGLGYDSIVYENLREGRYEDEGENDAYILFDPRQAKLADPVTYDNNGDVIPLSERFNQENPDIRFSINETDNEGKSLSEDQRTFFRYVAPELKDENGNLKRFYHGTGRADRVGYYFDPERATSGPMAYFTDNKDIATNYSQSKQDTSLAYESDDIHNYHNQFVVDVDGEEIRLEDYWHMLPASKRNEFKERAGHITRDWDTYELTYDENVTNGNGGYGNDPYLVRKARGNAFTMLIDAWLDSGDFFGEEENFLEVMNLLGMEGVKYKDPDYREEKVYEVYLNVTNPLVTSYIDDEFVADVKDWVDATDLDFYAKESAQADMWDKNSVDPYDWIERLESDVENDTTHAWTSIPDVITDFLKEQGYDGIVDKGGKGGGIGHQVVIPFSSEQIKDINNEHPTKENPDIRYSITPEMDEQYMDAVNSGNMDEAQRLVDEAAKMAGFDTPLLHHGTPSFGFTVFDRDKLDDGFSIFATNNPLTAETYSGVTNRSRISETSKVDVDNLHGDNLLNEIRKYRDRYDDFRLITDNEKEEIINESREDLALLANDAESFIEDNSDAFNDEKREIANRIVSSIRAMSKAFKDDEAWGYYRDFQDAVWDLKWMDESIQMELSDIIPEHRINMFLRKLVDFMYTGEIFVDDTFGFEYRFDNQLALELESDLRKGIYGLYGKSDNQLVIDANGENWNAITPPEGLGLEGPQKTRWIAEAARNKGYDSVLFKNLRDNGGETPYNGESDVYIFFNPSQVKSADPVTYAEDGSIIPLSERFDSTNNDIRYSLPTQDSDGNILTDGQMEYFKNSQARDRDGKLAVVYHTTNAGGFTVFDPEYSDDKRSLFFTSNFDMSQSYGTNAFRNLMREGTENISFDDFIKMDGPSISTVVATRLIDLLDPETGEVLWDGTENPVGTGSTLKYWYKKDNSKYLVSVGGEVMDREGFDRWMNEQAEDILYGYKNHGYYECYLNLEDPLIIECNGSNWDSIKEPDFESLFLSYDGEDFYIDGTTVPFSLEDIRDLYGVGFAERAEEWIETADPTDLEMGDTLYTWHGGPYDPEVEGHWPTEEDTRYWCNEAEALGYDGVIFRDLKDNGPYGKFKETGDVYVAFSSNQVKDTRNENPTENPDIRFSITPEDEAKSRIAYDDAMDNSYELLAYYEQQLANVNPETFDVTKAFREEDVVRFLDALKAEDAVPSADYKFEEDRVRRAKSKEDFYNNVYAKWNDRWTTEGEVLKISSVKRDITNLVKGAMANSDSDAQYRNEIVRKTLLDARIAYQLMKQDRTELASYLLYHSAQRMIDGLEFIRDDTAFKEYKEIRDYLRTYRINAPEEYWHNVEFNDFRKEYYGRLRIGKGNNNIEDVYSDLQSGWPHLFNEAEREKAGLGDSVEDLLQHIGVVVDSNVTPFMEAYSSEEAASLAYDLADQLYEIIANGDREISLADTYKERYDAKTKALKARHAEAILRERKIREEGIQKERQKFRAYKEREKEKQAHKKYFDRITETHDKLVERLASNTADKHIPEQYKKELAKLLAAFDLQTVGSKAREARTGHVAKNTIRMNAIKEALKSIEERTELFHVNDAITDLMDELSSVEGKTIDSLSSAELWNIDRLLKSLLHEFNRYEKVKIGVKSMQAADLASAQTASAIEHAKTFGPGNDYFGIKGWMDQIINMDEMTPAYMFKRIDPENVGLGLMWKEIKRSQDRYIRNTAQIQKWVEEIIGDYHNKGRFNKKYGSETIEKWRSSNYQQTYNLTNGTVQLTPAQAMSLYCLSKRNQAYGHMVGAGVVVAPVSFQAKIMSDLKRKTNRALPVILTDADIKTVVQSLTPEQIQVANQLQELMSTKMADLGNEASMNVLGIKLFNEQDYFPIKSDKAALERDLSNEEFENAIRNFGFTKAVQPGARNAIMIEDIFDVLTEHCNNMNLYNSYSETLNDFMKVFNKHTIMEDGSDYSVRQAVAHAYSQKATTFIMEFIRDLNGNVSKGRRTGLDAAMSDMLGRAKQASVFANIRVLLQQPTAITRAFAVIDPKYLKGVSLADVAKGSIPTVTTEAMQEMFDHCPIALWKSWGYYDINMGRSIESVIMNEGNFLEDLATSAYGKADNITWTAIWQMVKEETKDKHPELKEGTDEFWDHCNERMSEIVEFTQVVDSPLHRSHLMRSKQLHHKIFSAFMAEPTLTFNMIRDGYVTAREEWQTGNKGKAAKTMGRIAAVASLQAATVAAAAAIADAIRGKNKGGGDDDDDSFGALWYKNFLENLKDEAKIWNKVYYIKDLASIAEGWDNANLALQGWKTLTDGFRQFDKKMFEGSKTPWWNIYYNLLGGIGYFTGVPVKTLMKDGRAIFELLGGELPESLVGEEKSESVISSDSKLQSLRLFKGKGSSNKETVTSAVRVGLEDKWYDYENNPITVKDGSALDRILNHFGINLTASEKAQIAASQAQQERDSKAEEISNKYADLSGEERDKKVWSSVTTYYKNQGEDSKVFADMVANGDYGDINEMKSFYLKAGGNAEYFDKRVLAESKKALKKSIKYGQTNQEIDAQDRVKNYMMSHGVTEQEISEIAYKSATAKDMKIAFIINDKDAMLESLEPLVYAGLTYEDLERIWENRNRIDIMKYKSSKGRYADRLKSTGKYIWPTDGVITSHFGYRNAPTAGASSNHPAIDIGAPQGTAVVAADGGVVISAGANGGYGNSVGIKHDNGMITWYNHLYDWNVKVGDTVAQGQQIAQVGSTGISTGPHLDFKIMDTNGNPVDPEKYLEAR